MDTRQLRAFIGVFEERNITAASKRLGVTQPALSATIKELEDSLGVSLFERKARGVEVTAEGRILYPEARRMLAESEKLKERFKKFQNRIPLSVGIESDISPIHIEHFMKLAASIGPELLLQIEEGCSGEARLAPEEERCEDELFLPIWEEDYVLAAAPGNQKMLENLDEASWVVCPTHSSHQRLLPLYGMNASSPAAETQSLRFALNLVAAGVGIAAAPQSLVRLCSFLIEAEVPKIKLTRRIGLCYGAQALSNPMLKRLIEIVTSH
jgi:DNA-binding transcriptional LysR family regulator